MTETSGDEELMLRYRGGDAGAFDELYRRHKGPLYRYLLRQCGNGGIADELFQDVWMRIVKFRRGYEPNARFQTFLYSVAHHRVVDHYRRGQRPALSYSTVEAGDCNGGELPVAATGPSPEDQVDFQRQLENLGRLIDGLPEAQREAFLLKEEAGLTVEEIAVATQVNPETAKSRVRYAFARLRRGLSEML